MVSIHKKYEFITRKVIFSVDIPTKYVMIIHKKGDTMKNLPDKFLQKLSKNTGLQPNALSRYLAGGVVPRPDRANMLSFALRKEGVHIPPEDFVFNNKVIKKNIMQQLNEKKVA